MARASSLAANGVDLAEMESAGSGTICPLTFVEPR